jgi:cyclophilin family peptidyl-prolyl cis-trans isomerase
VGTAKRERQKANRAKKHEEQVRRERSASTKRTAVRVGIGVALALGLVVLIAWIGGAFDGDDDSAESELPPIPSVTLPPESETTPAGTTAPGDTTPAETSPSVPETADPADCPATDGSQEQVREFDAPPPFCIDPEVVYTAEIVTNQGPLTVELDPAIAPNTVNNFVVLARYRYFDDTVCHRAIPGFVVQCGDPTATGTGGPGYSFPDELPGAGAYQIGSLAMANSGPDTQGSQFFIITGEDGAALPPAYSLFGQVTEGLDDTLPALDALGNPDAASNGVPPLEEIRIESVTISEG